MQFFSRLYENFFFQNFRGGDAEDQAYYLKKKGREKIVQFVEKYGAGYISTCAGSYLALTHVENPIIPQLVQQKILDGTTKKWHYGLIDLTSANLECWNRGSGNVKLEFTSNAKKIFGINKKNVDCYYANGPLFRPLNDNEKKKDLSENKSSKLKSKVYVIATFKSEISKKKNSKGKMINTPAICCSTFGKGRVLVLSPHPEASPNEDAGNCLLKMINWVCKKL